LSAAVHMQRLHLQVLEAAEFGIDMFDTAYATELAAAGHALVFPLQPAPEQPDCARPNAEGDSSPTDGDGDADSEDPRTARVRGSKPSSAAAGRPLEHVNMDFADVALREDKAPLQPGCSCYTCSNYSRAYLHHLVQREELLASVLLELHNAHHMQSWFAVLRSVIAAGDFEQYAAWFRATCRVPAPIVREPLADAVSSV